MERHGGCTNFLVTGVEIARSHHERFDGTGYPDRLAGTDIPLSARITAIADMYDALRCKRAFRPALPHHAAVSVIIDSSPGQFDPILLEAFARSAAKFEAIYNEQPD
jgi:response regulator RpfG family c-di-GMP phosphodiesterase